jgi:threonine dehydrogenase-like Zn-dependent dehydrogenase
VPCSNCAVLEWDFCRNGQYTERGIKEHHGYCSERYRNTADFTIKVDQSLGLLGVLLEPTSVVAKAWEQADRAGARAHWEPKTALVTGAGPIGLLAALIGVQRGLDVHVLDQVTSGRKPDLVHDLGATYHTGKVADAVAAPDIIIECTGVPALVFDAMSNVGPGGVVVLTGVSSGGHIIDVDEGMLNRSMVLENVAVLGSVNANRRHYEAAAEALAKADRSWLERLVTRRVPLEQWREALTRAPDDVKVVIEVSAP